MSLTHSSGRFKTRLAPKLISDGRFRWPTGASDRRVGQFGAVDASTVFKRADKAQSIDRPTSARGSATVPRIPANEAKAIGPACLESRPLIGRRCWLDFLPGSIQSRGGGFGAPCRRKEFGSWGYHWLIGLPNRRARRLQRAGVGGGAARRADAAQFAVVVQRLRPNRARARSFQEGRKIVCDRFQSFGVAHIAANRLQ